MRVAAVLTGLAATLALASPATASPATTSPATGSAAGTTVGAATPAPGAGCAAAREHTGPWRITFVGDSMTQGLTGSATYRYWTWRGLRRAGVDAAFVGPRFVTNGAPAGLAAARTYEHPDHGFARQLGHAGRSRAKFPTHPDPPEQLVRRLRPDLVVLQLGYNDVNVAGVTARDVTRRTAGFVRALWATDARLGRPRTLVVLGQVPEAGRSPKLPLAEKNATTERANRMIRARLARPCLVEVNGLRDGLGAERGPDWDPARHTYDGTHPNAVGETLMAQRMLDAMRRLGVFAGRVDVVRPGETWAPAPAVAGSSLGGRRWRFDLTDELARTGSQRWRLTVTGPEGNTRSTDWLETPTAVLRVPRDSRVRAVVGRGRAPGLPMVSEPGPAWRVPTPGLTRD
ncbi:hypothetical protein GCM10009737_00660 [Nocardioides lentus]|uniref:SGNH hydrolase-type esterase domain-containing protein n=1 Tax=Nocardioides lentus TaxID=338077 RepID=A0ABP5A5A4_9ACTN